MKRILPNDSARSIDGWCRNWIIRTSVIPYHLACYACQLGRLEQAQAWLVKAMATRDAAQIKAMALGTQI